MEKCIKNICTLCAMQRETKCNEEDHKARGFSLSQFTNFSDKTLFMYLSDSIKDYLNKQAIIF